MIDSMWGLYNYDNLFGVFHRRSDAIEYAEKTVLTNDTWPQARRKGYMKIKRVLVMPEE